MRSIRKLDQGRLPILVFSGTIATADEVRELAALGVAGYINEYSAVQHILPSLAPHLFPDNFNRRGSPRVVLGIPVAYRFGNTIAAALDAESEQGRARDPDDESAAGRIEGAGRGSGCRDRSATSRRSRASPGATGGSEWGCSSKKSKLRRPGRDRRVRRSALLHEPQGLSLGSSTLSQQPQRIGDHHAATRPCRRSTAIHSVAVPVTASIRNAPFNTIENAMFARMFRIVARLRRNA